VNRTTCYKLQYAAAIAATLVLAAVVWWNFRDQRLMLIAIALVLFIPGRLSGNLWRDLYRGRRLFGRGQFEDSIESSRSFIRLLKARPNLRRLWWLAWSVYTRDPLAMALNNIGSAQLELGRLEEAESSFQEALDADPQYPIPHYNLALLCATRDQAELATEHAQTAIRLGYARDAVDRALHDAAGLLARIEGRGSAPRTDA